MITAMPPGQGELNRVNSFLGGLLHFFFKPVAWKGGGLIVRRNIQ